MSTITAKQLERLGACRSQVDKFRALFGESIAVSTGLVEHASVFDWDWAANRILSAPARAEYERVRASAWAEYERVCASARAEYERVCASARAECERVCASAFLMLYMREHP